MNRTRELTAPARAGANSQAGRAAARMRRVRTGGTCVPDKAAARARDPNLAGSGVRLDAIGSDASRMDSPPTDA